ncbi:MAG TPA: sodium:solute symporter family protein, partial [Armatimonadota bacterium]|nr:sodium:solute symporter family protein [Armatimonadota bacterium]
WLLAMNVSLLGLLSVLLITVVAGVWSAQKVSNAQDFDVGGHTFNSRLIIGALYGSFVGGTSLIGTSQLAYQLGVGAIWFTFGGAAGIALMGLLSPALGNFRRETIPQLIESSFGPQSRISTSLYMTVGMFIQVIAQVLAAIPLLESLLPVSTHTAALIAALLILASVWAGGLWGTSLVGIFKTLLMMTAFCVVGILVAGDFSRMQALQVLPLRPWFNFFPHGVFTDFAAGLSVCIGTMSTQTYWQPLFAARSTRDAR